MKNSPVLLIPEKTDSEFEQIFATWTDSGGSIKRLGRYWVKDEVLAKQPIAIYGNQTFALVLAQIYNVDLLSPDDTLIARLESKWTGRRIELKQVKQVMENDFPVFIKPVVPKIFAAGIFQTLSDFEQVTIGLPDNEEILASSVVDEILAEARAFIMDGVIKDIALYEGAADLTTGKTFLTDFLNSYRTQLPDVVVVDVAFNESIGWFVLEFNACWGAGLNNCNARKVIDCIIGATVNKKS
ncbi:ATP-grasp domain-containing protein [Chitinophaga sp. RCC_12]|uniref:ATP-grasp domain-containing protein n=1 Tax=Chitinophaga sp. RCC_12 TaxID=3239226 RepID=UPI00352589E1